MKVQLYVPDIRRSAKEPDRGQCAWCSAHPLLPPLTRWPRTNRAGRKVGRPLWHKVAGYLFVQLGRYAVSEPCWDSMLLLMREGGLTTNSLMIVRHKSRTPPVFQPVSACNVRKRFFYAGNRTKVKDGQMQVAQRIHPLFPCILLSV